MRNRKHSGQGKNVVIRTLGVMACILLLWASAVAGQSIGLYADSSCVRCNLNLDTGQTRDLYVAIMASPFNPEEVASGEFRVQGLPASWQTNVTRMSYVFDNGDPLDAGVSFALLEPQTRFCIPLYRVEVTATTQVADLTLSIEPHEMPIFFDCAVLGLCNPLCDTRVCVGGGSMFVNSATNCMVSIKEETWSAIKSMYNR